MLIQSRCLSVVGAFFLVLLAGCSAAPDDSESASPSSSAIAQDEKITQRLFKDRPSKGSPAAQIDSWTGYRLVKMKNGQAVSGSEAVVLQASYAGAVSFEMVFKEDGNLVAFRTPDATPAPYTLSQAQAEAVAADMADLKKLIDETPSCGMAWFGTILSGVLAVPVNALAGVVCIAPPNLLCPLAFSVAAFDDVQLYKGATALSGCLHP